MLLSKANNKNPIKGLVIVSRPLFRPEVQAKQQQRLAGTVNLTRPLSVLSLTWLLLLIVTVAVIYLANAQYSRKQTVSGVLQPSAGVVRLQLAESGIIGALLVREGEQVRRGQPLLLLNKQQFDSSQQELGSTLLQQSTEVLSRLGSEKQQLQQSHQLAVRQQQDKIEALARQLSETDNQLTTLQSRLQLNREQLTQLKKLAGTGYISQLEINRQQDSLLQLEQQEQQLQAARLQLQAEQRQQQSAAAQLPLLQQTELSQLENQIAEQTARQAQLNVQQTTTLVAPADGRVSALQVKAGQWQAQGQVALTLLPLDEQLEAVLYVPTSAIGFLQQGQQARLRYDAYPYQRFGVFGGEVTEVSETVLLPADVSDFVLSGPSFRVRVRLPAQQISAYQRQLPLKAGMTLQADLITERQTLLQWLFDPIYSLRGQL